ncbi:MAG: tRNA (5-methylaminomethyl-2-thiouridylate)-methyltransferase, partial [Akkermansiaceae bacterium]|nr:tRNA (5-methylaminomethyl-2-thiouridylate)-methyltransferase [Akkermansiaceae bacterium]
EVATNRLVVGWDESATPGLYASHCVIGSVSTIGPSFDKPQWIEAQPRYRAKAERAEITPREDGKLDLRFQTPQRAIAAGQICAFYDGGRLLGGGVFETAR